MLKYKKIQSVILRFYFQFKNISYICTVFFMVLDLRLIRRLVVVRQPFFIFGKSLKPFYSFSLFLL